MEEVSSLDRFPVNILSHHVQHAATSPDIANRFEKVPYRATFIHLIPGCQVTRIKL